MLVLSRKTEEKILIGDDIIITVLEVKGNRVRLGIQAPGDCSIIRGELTGVRSKTLVLAEPALT